LTDVLSIKPAQTSVVSYGAGTNSTAMLVGLHERGERPDLILFADTGGERPETYRHRGAVSDWCESVGFPRIVTVAEGQDLETDCLTRGALPGIAYGFSCQHLAPTATGSPTATARRPFVGRRTRSGASGKWDTQRGGQKQGARERDCAASGLRATADDGDV
jgi:hypothetical protein